MGNIVSKYGEHVALCRIIVVMYEVKRLCLHLTLMSHFHMNALCVWLLILNM